MFFNFLHLYEAAISYSCNPRPFLNDLRTNKNGIENHNQNMVSPEQDINKLKASEELLYCSKKKYMKKKDIKPKQFDSELSDIKTKNKRRIAKSKIEEHEYIKDPIEEDFNNKRKVLKTVIIKPHVCNSLKNDSKKRMSETKAERTFQNDQFDYMFNIESEKPENLDFGYFINRYNTDREYKSFFYRIFQDIHKKEYKEKMAFLNKFDIFFQEYMNSTNMQNFLLLINEAVDMSLDLKKNERQTKNINFNEKSAKYLKELIYILCLFQDFTELIFPLLPDDKDYDNPFLLKFVQNFHLINMFVNDLINILLKILNYFIESSTKIQIKNIDSNDCVSFSNNSKKEFYNYKPYENYLKYQKNELNKNYRSNRFKYILNGDQDYDFTKLNLLIGFDRNYFGYYKLNSKNINDFIEKHKIYKTILEFQKEIIKRLNVLILMKHDEFRSCIRFLKYQKYIYKDKKIELGTLNSLQSIYDCEISLDIEIVRVSNTNIYNVIDTTYTLFIYCFILFFIFFWNNFDVQSLLNIMRYVA